MLLLVTIGLVLIAAVTLVIGFVSNSLTPIYISIVCSAVAALVLYLFYRMNRRRPAGAGGRRPLVDSTPPVFSRGSSAPAPRRQSSKVLTGSGSTAPGAYDDDAFAADQPRFAEPPVASDPPTQRFRRVAPAAAPPAAPPRPAPAPVAAPAPAPEPEVVAAAPTRGRPEPLAVAETAPGAGPAGSTSMASPPAPVAVPAAAAGAAAAGWSEPLPFPIEEYDDLRVVQIIPLLPELDDQELQAVREYELGNRNRMAIVSRIDGLLADAGDEDDGADEAEAPAPATAADDLPIADYDFLGVSEILPLLGELDADELEQVRDYEETGRGRATVVVRIDSLLAAMAEPEPEPEPEAAPEPEPEPEAAAGASLPIAGYDKLRVFQILAMLPELDDAELEAVREYEQANRSRITILNQVEAQRSGAAPPAAPQPSAAPAARPAPPEPEPEPEPAVDAAGLPIADYDDLAQGEILPLLDELEDDELADVRDYEDAHRSRVAILFRIDALLGPAEAEAGGEGDEAAEAAEAPDGNEAEAAPQDEAVPDSAPEAAAEEDEEQWGELPIADYDDLSQIEILPLLDQLYDDELDDLRDYEETHRARVAILFRIDALLAGEEEGASEPEAHAAEPGAEAAEAAEADDEPEAPAAEAGEGAQGAEGVDTAGAQGDADAGDALTAEDLPIADYDELTVSEILPLLAELDDDELADVRDYEDVNLGRVAIIARIDSMYEPSDEADAEGAPGDEPESEAAAAAEEPEAGAEEAAAGSEAGAEEGAAEPEEAERRVRGRGRAHGRGRARGRGGCARGGRRGLRRRRGVRRRDRRVRRRGRSRPGGAPGLSDRGLRRASRRRDPSPAVAAPGRRARSRRPPRGADGQPVHHLEPDPEAARPGGQETFVDSEG